MKKFNFFLLVLLLGCSEADQSVEIAPKFERTFVSSFPSDLFFAYTSSINPFTGKPFEFTTPHTRGKTNTCVAQSVILDYDCSIKTYQLKFKVCTPGALSFDWYLTYNGVQTGYIGSTAGDKPDFIYLLANRPAGNYGCNVVVNIWDSVAGQIIATSYQLNSVSVSFVDCLYIQRFNGVSNQGIGNGYYPMDFNGDGKTDVVQTWNNNNKMALLVYGNLASGSYNPTYSTTTNNGAVHITCVPVDVNGDRRTDLVQAWNNGGRLNLILYTSTGSAFSSGTNIPTSNGAVFLKLLPVDIDGDQKTDLAQLWDNGNRLSIIVYRSNGSTLSQYWSGTTTHGSGNVGFTVGDINNDGKTDIIQFFDNQGSLSIVAHKSQGTAFETTSTSITNTTQGSGNVGFIPVNYNYDGRVDLIHAWNHEGLLNVFLQIGSANGTFSEIWQSNMKQGAANLAMLPFNGLFENSGFLQVYNDLNRTAFIFYDKSGW